MKKGVAGYFVVWSIIGILVGLFMVFKGYKGEGLGSMLTLIIGIFVVVKEIADIIH
jgi:hypothetical protein